MIDLDSISMESLAIRAYQRSSTVPLLFCSAEVTTRWLRSCSYTSPLNLGDRGAVNKVSNDSVRQKGNTRSSVSAVTRRIPFRGETVLILRKRRVGVQFPFFVEEKGNLSLYG